MALIIFAMAINPETKELSYSGSMTLQQAGQLIQGAILSEAIEKAKKEAVGEGRKGNRAERRAGDRNRSKKG